jgi:hypothetical protein
MTNSNDKKGLPGAFVNNSFCLPRGADETEIRGIFSQAMLLFCLQHRRLCVEDQGDTHLCCGKKTD